MHGFTCMQTVSGKNVKLLGYSRRVPKQGDTKIMAITPLIRNRFSEFFIVRFSSKCKVFIKDPTTPHMHHYTTSLLLITILLQIHLRINQWKPFENWLRSDRDITMSIVSPFLWNTDMVYVIKMLNLCLPVRY